MEDASPWSLNCFNPSRIASLQLKFSRGPESFPASRGKQQSRVGSKEPKQALHTKGAAGTCSCGVRMRKSFLWDNREHEPKLTGEKEGPITSSSMPRSWTQKHWRGKPMCIPWLVLSLLVLPFVCLYMMLFDILQVATHIIF